MVVVLSPLAYILFGLLASRVNLAIAGSLVNLIIMIGAVLVGLFYFKERVTTLQWIGIGPWSRRHRDLECGECSKISGY